MGVTVSRTFDGILSATAQRIEETGWAAELCDCDWNLVWVSGQMRTILGHPTDEELGIGRHMLASRLSRAWLGSPDRVTKQWIKDNVPLMIEQTPGGLDAMREMVGPELRPLLEGLKPSRIPAWTSVVDFTGEPIGIGPVRYFGVRPRDTEGNSMGAIYLYGSSLPASLLTLVARGDPQMFERMARLVEPGRRSAAILFADLQASGPLSRHLSSAAYFTLIRELTTAMDEAIIDECGIVGKHAGDGVTGFFLEDDAGSASSAAARCIAAARRVAAATGELSESIAPLEPSELRINIGLHWGGTLYMGQVVTGGRLEVTALGDEVNEAARVQQAARDGAVLVSKSLVERLDADDARTSRVDPAGVTYRALAEVAPGSEKIVRDAGTLAVTEL
jgi:class 3 adenylate cyclase